MDEQDCPHCFGYGGLHEHVVGGIGDRDRVHRCRLCWGRCTVPTACAVEYALLSAGLVRGTPTRDEVDALSKSYGLRDVEPTKSWPNRGK